MAWNSSQNKSITPSQTKSVPIGTPIAATPGMVGKPYRDGWDINRAYRDGLAKVTWVFRAVDAIAGNQARLPAIFRKDNSPDGEIIRKHDSLKVLNTKSNIAESSSIFRYRLSSQLMLSSRGVFIEVVRSQNGKPYALHLLPPQSTSPLPHPKTFVSGYEVEMPDGRKEVLKPDRVIWIRRPHPLDPYLSMTPLQAAGIAVEVEALAKLYNRNFLLNDGRPGGLLVLRGEIDEDDKNELRSRFRGNINRTGMVGVISAEDGVDFVDTAANPRDAAYIQMRQITKEEILAAFGVPESIIGNASGRTFSNASEEGKVFWMETMMPHLDVIARGFDDLEDDYLVDFDTSEVPILILAKQERQQFLLNEFTSGLISANEYRDGSGRKKVKAELSDALLVNPNLTPIGNTEKEMKQEPPPGTEGAPLDVQSGQVPVMDSSQQGQQPPGQPAQPAAAAPTPAPAEATPAPEAGKSVAAVPEGVETKRWDLGPDWGEKVARDTARWEQIMAKTLERFFARQQRVVLEKAMGKKARKALEDGNLSVDNIFDISVWNKQLEEDIRPVLTGIMVDAADSISKKVDSQIDLLDGEGAPETVAALVENSKGINNTTKTEIAGAILMAAALKDDDGNDADIAIKAQMLRSSLSAIFLDAVTKRMDRITEDQTLAAYNGGVYFSGRSSGVNYKRWLTVNDDKVRLAHRKLHGKMVEIDEGFAVGKSMLRFPKDPLAPPELTMGCRCFLAFGG